jgi:hypothetical protein
MVACPAGPRAQVDVAESRSKMRTNTTRYICMLLNVQAITWHTEYRIPVCARTHNIVFGGGVLVPLRL